MLRDPNDLTATAATLFLLQRDSATHAETFALGTGSVDISKRHLYLSRPSRSMVFALIAANSLNSERCARFKDTILLFVSTELIN